MSGGELRDRDLDFRFQEQDALATRELNRGARNRVGKSMLKWYGTPLLPSLGVLAAVGMHWLALAFGGMFLLFVAYCAWKSSAPLKTRRDEVHVEIRDDYIHVASPAGESRRHWAWFEDISVHPSWICLNRRGFPQMTIPRRLFDEHETQQLAAELRQRVEAAAQQPTPAYETFDCGSTDASGPFIYDRQELEDLLRGRLELTSGVDETRQNSPGCLSALIMMMLVAAVLIGTLPFYSFPRRVSIWAAVCAAMWLPWLTWHLMTPLRIKEQLEDAEQNLLKDQRRHAVGPRGLVDQTGLVQELFPWSQITRIEDARAFVFCYTPAVFLATPKRALDDPEEYLQQAKSHFDLAQQQSEQEPDREQDPGPAVESGNPYQPPRD